MQNGIGVSEQEEISPIKVLWSKKLSKEGVVVTALRSVPAHRGNAHVCLPPQHYYQGLSRIQLNLLTMFQSSQSRLALLMTSKVWHRRNSSFTATSSTLWSDHPIGIAKVRALFALALPERVEKYSPN